MNFKDNSQPERSFLIEGNELFSDLREKRGTTLFLGKYSLSEVKSVLTKKNFYREAKKRKLIPLEFYIDSSEFPPLQRFQIFTRKKSSESLVVDLKIKKSVYRIKDELNAPLSGREFNFLCLDWLTLQDPSKAFSSKRSQLPGQKYPGLSLGKKVLDIFVYLARLMKTDGLLAFPAYFHNALLFSRYLYFINPNKKGEVMAIQKAFSKVTFHQLAWIVHLNCLRDNKGNVYEWKAEEQLLPLNDDLKKYFESKVYKERILTSLNKYNFTIDWDCYQKKKDLKIQD